MAINYLSEFSILAIALHMALMSPGPDFMVTLRQTINYGKKHAYYSSLGIGLGIVFHLSYTFLGIGLIFTTFPYLFQAIKLLGALYLIYLGVGSIISRSSKLSIAKEKSATYDLKKSFYTGFLTDVLNPKTTLFFVSIFTSIVSVKTPLYIQGLYGIYCILANILWYMLIAHLLSKESNFQLFNKYRIHIERIIGLILIELGLVLIYKL